MANTNTAAILPFDAPKPKTGLTAMLKKADKVEPKGKKSTIVTVGNAPENIKAMVDEVMEAITAKKQAEAVIEVGGPELHEYARALHDADGFSGNFHSTYALVGNRATAKVGFVNKYTLSPDDETRLKEILGKNYPAMITETPTVTLKKSVLEDEAKGNRLVELLGDEFLDFFEVKPRLTVCEGFNKIVYQVLSPEQLAELRIFAKQNTPSIKS